MSMFAPSTCAVERHFGERDGLALVVLEHEPDGSGWFRVTDHYIDGVIDRSVAISTVRACAEAMLAIIQTIHYEPAERA